MRLRKRSSGENSKTSVESERLYIEKLIQALNQKIQHEKGITQEQGLPKDTLTLRIENLILWYISKSTRAKHTYYNCSLLITGIPLIIAVVNSITTSTCDRVIWAPVVITLLSGVTSLLSSWLVLSRSQENWIRYRNAAEDLKDEVNRYLAEVDLYQVTPDNGGIENDNEKAKEKRYQKLAERVAWIVQNERKQWSSMRNRGNDNNRLEL